MMQLVGQEGNGWLKKLELGRLNFVELSESYAFAATKGTLVEKLRWVKMRAGWLQRYNTIN
jgi:hypothetical protein